LSEAASAKRWALMGDPTHFSVRGGANPHTRTRWGSKRHVNRERAITQWHGLRDTLTALGVNVLVVPPIPDWPGSVYPANAGFMRQVDTPTPVSAKRFYLANLLPTRVGEKTHYQKLLEEVGIQTLPIDEAFRMEGEADFFPVGDLHLLTHGHLERQRFVPSWSIPPWKRIYGFRTDLDVEPLLQQTIGERRILKIELTLETHYHGDTVLCAFGPDRKFLLGYRDGITAASWQRLRDHFKDHLIELSTEDASHYAANSFTFTQGTDSALLMPSGVSDKLLAQIHDHGVTPITVDVSEFLKKGGG